MCVIQEEGLTSYHPYFWILSYFKTDAFNRIYRMESDALPSLSTLPEAPQREKIPFARRMTRKTTAR